MEWLPIVQVVGTIVTWTIAILSIAAYLSTRLKLRREVRARRRVEVLGGREHRWLPVELVGDRPDGVEVERCETCGLLRLCTEIGSLGEARIEIGTGGAPPWMAALPSRN